MSYLEIRRSPVLPFLQVVGVTMLDLKRLDQVVTRAAESVPRWVQLVILVASIVILIAEFWPR